MFADAHVILTDVTALIAAIGAAVAAILAAGARRAGRQVHNEIKLSNGIPIGPAVEAAAVNSDAVKQVVVDGTHPNDVVPKVEPPNLS